MKELIKPNLILDISDEIIDRMCGEDCAKCSGVTCKCKSKNNDSIELEDELLF